MLSTFTIRKQLLGLFGLMLLAGAAVLLIDEIDYRRDQQTLEQIQKNSLSYVRRIKLVSDAYRLDMVDTTFRVRNYLLSWEKGATRVKFAQLRLRNEWQLLEKEARANGQSALFDEIIQVRKTADAAGEQLHNILLSRDIKALGQFADGPMFPSMDPVTTRLNALTDIQLVETDRLLQQETKRSKRVSLLRLTISVGALLIAALIGRYLLRNIYRGVESLTALAAQMRRQDFTALHSRRPDGELGDVMDGFLLMREDIRDYQNRLNQQLQDNEEVRQSLQRSEMFQRSLFAAARVAVMSLDSKGLFTSFNPFAEKLTGYRASEMLGQRNALLLLDPAELQLLRKELTVMRDRAIDTDMDVLLAVVDSPYSTREWSFKHKNGAQIPVLVGLSAVRDQSGDVAGYLAVATDLTEIKQLEKKLRASEVAAREANVAKSTFLAAMSHEIRTPMVGVTGLLEVLSYSPLNDEQKRVVNIIQQSAATLLQIIGDILDFSRVEAGRTELSLSTISVQDLLQSVAENFSSAASAKGLVLTVKSDPKVSRAHVGDPLRIRQIVSNFFSNAIKFTERGFIEAEVEFVQRNNTQEQICIRVTDTGIGVSAEQQARLFQPFQQAESSTSRRYGGSGLGLAISKRLAELMGGEVLMQSALGEGTTVRLMLNLPIGSIKDIEQADMLAGKKTFPRRALPSITEAEQERSLVLVIDDHPTNRLVASKQLALAGFAHECAEDAQQGLALWRSGRFSIIFTDVHMPGMDGYQMTRLLRQEEKVRHLTRTPVIALTAAAMKGEGERCLAAGMDHYLSKPVALNDLLTTLYQWLPHTLPAAATGSVANKANQVLNKVAEKFDSSRIFDPAMIRELIGDDRAETTKLLKEFWQATERDLRALNTAVESQQMDQVFSEAHKIKGASKLVGAIELAELAGQMEEAAKQQQTSHVLSEHQLLKNAADKLRLYIETQYSTQEI